MTNRFGEHAFDLQVKQFLLDFIYLPTKLRINYQNHHSLRMVNFIIQLKIRDLEIKLLFGM